MKNRLIYLGFLLIMLYLFVFYYNVPMLLIMIGIFVFPILSLVSAIYIRSFLTFDLIIEKERIEKSEGMRIKVRVKNESYFPIRTCFAHLEIENGFFEQVESGIVEIPIRIKEETDCIFEINSKYAGDLKIRICKIIYSDFLGLKKFEMVSEVEKILRIMPKLLGFEMDKDWETEQDEEAETKNKKGEDTSEVEQIREYQSGDRLQRIHWKLSVKMDDWMIKEYAGVYEKEIPLIVEMYAPENKVLDELIDVIYSVSNKLLEMGEKFTVYLLNLQSEMLQAILVENKEDIQNLMDSLYGLRPYLEEEPALERFLYESGGQELRCFYITANSQYTAFNRKIAEFDGQVMMVCI